MGIALRPNRKDTTPAIPRPVPYTRGELEAHYFPPEPATAVTQAEHASAIAAARTKALIAERDERRAHYVLARRAIVAAALAGDADAVATAAAEGAQDAATLIAIGHELDLLSHARRDLAGVLAAAKHSDPDYRVWHSRCQRLHMQWFQATMSGTGGSREERDESRERAIRGFAAVAAAQLDSGPTAAS